MSKVLVDRELLERALATSTKGMRDTMAARSELAAILARPAEAEVVVQTGSDAWMALHLLGRLDVDADEELRVQQVEEIVRRMGAALSAVTAERDAARDALRAEQDRYQRDVYGLNNEGDPIGGEPAGGYANDNAKLRAEVEYLRTDALSFGDAYQAVRHSLSRASNGERFSISLVQRTFLLGYNSALRLIEDMARRGDIVPDGDGCGYRFPGAAMAAKEGGCDERSSA